MCNLCEPPVHGDGHHHEHAAPRKLRLVSRRAFLAGAGNSAFALLTKIGAGRGTIAVTLGATATGLAACAAPPAAPVPSAPEAATAAPTAAPTETVATAATLPPVDYRIVNLGFVNAYVLVRGNEVAVVDTGVANSQNKIGEVIKAAGRSWEDVRHVILTHHHPDHVGSLDAVMALAVNATAYNGLYRGRGHPAHSDERPAESSGRWRGSIRFADRRHSRTHARTHRGLRSHLIGAHLGAHRRRCDQQC